VKLNSENPGAIMMAELNVLGAAVKIILAGGAGLTEDQAKRASGASYHLWKAKSDTINSLVSDLEG